MVIFYMTGWLMYEQTALIGTNNVRRPGTIMTDQLKIIINYVLSSKLNKLLG